MQDLGIGSSSTHGSCSPAKFDSGQGSEGSSGDQGELGHGQGLSSPGRVSSSSSQISSDLQMSGLQRSGLPPPASKDNCSSLLDTSDESSLDSLELDQVRYILKPKLHKYSHVNNNNNNNNNNSSTVNNKNKSKAVGTKCHITITNNDHSTAAAQPQPPQPPPTPANTTTTTAATAGDESSGSTRPVLMIDPRCQEIVSGHVTMVTVEGGAVAGQIERLQAEVTRLKVEKLELLRQNVSAQVVKIFHDLKNISLSKTY